jgi:hypothetical protein
MALTQKIICVNSITVNMHNSEEAYVKVKVN